MRGPDWGRVGRQMSEKRPSSQGWCAVYRPRALQPLPGTTPSRRYPNLQWISEPASGSIFIPMTSWRALDSPPATETVLNSCRRFGCHSSVANLDARPVPNAPISIPNRGASGPVACRCYIHGSGRNVDGGRCVVAGAARNRGSKQCTNRQTANDAGGYVTTSCNSNPWCD